MGFRSRVFTPLRGAVPGVDQPNWLCAKFLQPVTQRGHLQSGLIPGMTTPTPQPGWHPDPEGKPQLRWWDGQQWTAATQPHPTQPGPVSPPSPSGFGPKTHERNDLTNSSQPYPDLARAASSSATRNGLGISALVLAIVGVVFGLVPLTGFIALILGALAILFGLLGFGRVRKGLATNKVMALAGTGLGVVAAALGVWGMTIFFSAVDELDQKLDDLAGSASPIATEPATGDTHPGSRENPLAPGETATLRGWNITIHSTSLDMTDAVLAENQFNDPPVTGRQFVMADVSTTYTGTDTGTPWIDLNFRILGSSNNVFGRASADSCGVIPNALSDTGELYPGGSLRGNVCVSVPAEQVSGATWIVKASFSGDEEVFVSLQ